MTTTKNIRVYRSADGDIPYVQIITRVSGQQAVGQDANRRYGCRVRAERRAVVYLDRLPVYLILESLFCPYNQIKVVCNCPVGHISILFYVSYFL
jgi:hypothetical protein